jgi:hypothetical protein
MAVSCGVPQWRGGQESESSRAEQLFTELDGRTVGCGLDRWVLQVLGIHTSANDIWIQAAPAGDATRSLVLHFSARSSAEGALGALATWSSLPDDQRPRVIEVNESADTDEGSTELRSLAHLD